MLVQTDASLLDKVQHLLYVHSTGEASANGTAANCLLAELPWRGGR